eukprot:gene19469-biopygen964
MRTAPGARKVGPDDRMSSGSSLAFQRLSREPVPFILSVRLAGTKKARDAPGKAGVQHHNLPLAGCAVV